MFFFLLIKEFFNVSFLFFLFICIYEKYFLLLKIIKLYSLHRTQTMFHACFSREMKCHDDRVGEMGYLLSKWLLLFLSTQMNPPKEAWFLFKVLSMPARQYPRLSPIELICFQDGSVYNRVHVSKVE